MADGICPGETLTLAIAGRRVTFVDVPSFDFALASRTALSARAADWMLQLSRQEIDAELHSVRRIRRQLERELQGRGAGKRNDLGPLQQLIAGLVADEHCWHAILHSLHDAGQCMSGFGDVVLVRLGEYVACRESLLLGRRRVAPSLPGSGPPRPEPDRNANEAEDPLVRTEDELPTPGRSATARDLHSFNPGDVADREREGVGVAAGAEQRWTDVDPEESPVLRPDPHPLRAAPATAADPPPTTEATDTPSVGPPARRLTPGKREDINLPGDFAMVLECAGHRVILYQEGTNASATLPGFTLKKGANVIGRDPACDVVLHRDGNRISRMHVVVVSTGNGHFEITDLSRNGTWYLGGRNVHASIGPT